LKAFDSPEHTDDAVGDQVGEIVVASFAEILDWPDNDDRKVERPRCSRNQGRESASQTLREGCL
jgi:hypothetical protein